MSLDRRHHLPEYWFLLRSNASAQRCNLGVAIFTLVLLSPNHEQQTGR